LIKIIEVKKTPHFRNRTAIIIVYQKITDKGFITVAAFVCLGRRTEAWTSCSGRLHRAHHPHHDEGFGLHQVHERPPAGEGFRKHFTQVNYDSSNIS
jgi:hypothetical protein